MELKFIFFSLRCWLLCMTSLAVTSSMLKTSVKFWGTSFKFWLCPWHFYEKARTNVLLQIQKFFPGLDVLGNGWSFVGFFYHFYCYCCCCIYALLSTSCMVLPDYWFFHYFSNSLLLLRTTLFFLSLLFPHNCLSCISHLLFLKIIDYYCLLSNIALLLSCANFAQFYIKWLIISLVISVINLFLI